MPEQDRMAKGTILVRIRQQGGSRLPLRLRSSSQRMYLEVDHPISRWCVGTFPVGTLKAYGIPVRSSRVSMTILVPLDQTRVAAGVLNKIPTRWMTSPVPRHNARHPSTGMDVYGTRKGIQCWGRFGLYDIPDVSKAYERPGGRRSTDLRASDTVRRDGYKARACGRVRQGLSESGSLHAHICSYHAGHQATSDRQLRLPISIRRGVVIWGRSSSATRRT
jgi:hypothetical protein